MGYVLSLVPCNVRRTVESARGRIGVARAVDADKTPARKIRIVNLMMCTGGVPKFESWTWWFWSLESNEEIDLLLSCVEIVRKQPDYIEQWPWSVKQSFFGLFSTSSSCGAIWQLLCDQSPRLALWSPCPWLINSILTSRKCTMELVALIGSRAARFRRPPSLARLNRSFGAVRRLDNNGDMWRH